ncbi:MAG: arginase family protein [Nanoarchaeota archaeon]|nr:arginase family protein [Nanoarchaeota archaeon]MBU1445464.1 arginase family protein [Nanoarchaeota archaeon]MBU2406679.1 arginase family protein [Nanoarchaeota archaeon]MBU2420662.1 arginase family protein [Nanoarchaeota archaeon]MBU2475399.1 arginase family protein [Nanoarchaeota archaeon]
MKIIKVETSEGAQDKNEGCQEAPSKILEEFKNIHTNEFWKKPFYQIDSVEIKNDLKEDMSAIEEKASQVQGVFLGGSHTITYSIVKGLKKKFKDVGIISFDAHPDVFKLFDFPSHGDWLLYLIEEGIVKAENVILVGIRSFHKEEIDYLKEKGIKFFTMKQLFNGLDDVCDSVMESARKFEALHLSLDIDVIDPSAAPGTGCLEPGGLSTREFLHFIQRVKLLGNIKSVDLVEVNPRKDVNNLTVKLAAKILGEFS